MLIPEYLFTAVYTEDGITEVTHSEISGGTVATASEKIGGQTVASKWIYLMSMDGTEISYDIIPTSQRNLEDEKVYAGEYKELNHNGHNAIYFVDNHENATADVCVSYEVNEDILLYITYEGPVADEIGIDQLARNIYDLIEVIE